jgi:hypothetical protein
MRWATQLYRLIQQPAKCIADITLVLMVTIVVAR